MRAAYLEERGDRAREQEVRHLLATSRAKKEKHAKEWRENNVGKEQGIRMTEFVYGRIDGPV
jgi:hypothetical protein